MKKKIHKGFAYHTPSNDAHGAAYAHLPAPLIKKAFGQHFLRKDEVVHSMTHGVTITAETSVLEIGCGDGFLTRAILQTPCKKVVCYEIDPEWAAYVTKTIPDKRLEIRLKNILEVDLASVAQEGPWVILANLPYNITFPILSLLEKHKHLFQDIIVMVQEEVAQKLAATHGRSLGAPSFFYQHRFSVTLLDKIEPQAFTPPPKVWSRLVKLTPKTPPVIIPNEEMFWKFIKLCFASPRQTLRNNLRTTHYNLTLIDPNILNKRSQELSFSIFLELWNLLS